LIFTVANEQVGKNHVPNYFGKWPYDFLIMFQALGGREVPTHPHIYLPYPPFSTD
jgi:hypothetical protein